MPLKSRNETEAGSDRFLCDVTYIRVKHKRRKYCRAGSNVLSIAFRMDGGISASKLL